MTVCRAATPSGAINRLVATLGLLAASFVLTVSAALAAEPIRNVHYTYDLMGRQLTAKFDSAIGTDGVTNTYNGFGDLLTSRLKMGNFDKTLTSIYDGAGRRTRLTHPDSQAFTYAYDDLSRLSGVYQGTGTATPLATFTYADNGLVSARGEGTGASGATYGWDDINRLTTQSDTFAAGTNNVAWTFGYNPASQITTETRTNDNYGYAKSAASASYAVNGLNQYTSAGGMAHSYDLNGNLTSDGTTTYFYDVENRLVKAVAGGNTTNLTYDPLGRLYQIDRGTSGTTKKLLHDGDAMVAELGNSNAVTRRYVHGSNAAADDPLVWYEGATLTNKRWLHADHLGSIVAVTNDSGGSPTINNYDEYGAPAAANSGRFQYTGQAWIGELSLYYYKARFYDPKLGRFMQTDPVGYEDQTNLYAYVGSDPINRNDPKGLYLEQTACTGSRLCDVVGLALGVSGSTTADPTGRLAASTLFAASGGTVLQKQTSLGDAIVRGRQIAREELTRTQRVAPPGAGLNDVYDAERHARWTYRMARELGSGFAQLFSEQHEYEGLLRGQPLREFRMDMHNNMIGIRAFEKGDPIPTTSTPGLMYLDAIDPSIYVEQF